MRQRMIRRRDNERHDTIVDTADEQMKTERISQSESKAKGAKEAKEEEHGIALTQPSKGVQSGLVEDVTG